MSLVQSGDVLVRDALEALLLSALEAELARWSCPVRMQEQRVLE